MSPTAHTPTPARSVHLDYQTLSAFHGGHQPEQTGQHAQPDQRDDGDEGSQAHAITARAPCIPEGAWRSRGLPEAARPDPSGLRPAPHGPLRTDRAAGQYTGRDMA